VLIFPELSLTGYSLHDLAARGAIRPNRDDPVFRPLLEASHDLDMVVGFVDEDARHRFYIAAAYLSRGEVLHVHHKVYLPTYGLFDEGRLFAGGDHIRAFDTRFGRVGLLICEDVWHERLESARWVEHINQAYASLFTSFVAHTNRVGFEDGLNFWGGATIYDPNGNLVARGPYHEEALTIAEINLNNLHHTRARLPLLRDERTNLVQRELGRILGGSR
jgi:predicted amidohydrolase